MSNRIRLAVGLGRGGGFQAAVRRARLDRFTSARRPKLRPRPTPPALVIDSCQLQGQVQADPFLSA